MHRIFRNSLICMLSCWCIAQAGAMSKGPVPLDVKRIDGKPAACIPMSDDGGKSSMRLGFVGVSRATGPTSPNVIYWQIEVPDDAPPIYLKRGECIVYGQSIPGATVLTPPKPFDFDKWYNFAVMPGGEDDGPIYRGSFCVRKKPGGGGRVVLPSEGGDTCSSGK
ncbi:hypothetical protein [Burkholderia oklahomensis]|uniref:Lipoprotein n=1 Tax=Burkholderia oklahomensis TaxID=342113 RepID=A0AAI8B6G5_9BURK|nr:hypothetical protein [Burkholderia oklahomensis]AIO66475.1 putative lipoprotein [Burkholderia oklahomensis]AOI42792.1 hypothetical protein WG70_24895 [Burkholderia oklahomensis EO147]AOI46285.1 hypothetical protein WI23_11105 [Burkholderia oklahomensis C6786]KUY53956.1 hypothetical protein WI23_01385 [Burkholderia oklahomensis C6786]KUY54534.1 hypothetical protein WG70_12710 [Burkholderia oklahomensis EO147]